MKVQYLLKRIFFSLPVLLGVVCIVSMLIHIVPGDPVDAIFGDAMVSDEEKEEMREQLGLNLPIHTQLTSYLGNLLKGDLGNSIMYHQSVAEMILERFLPTFELAVVSILVALLISLPLGLIAATNKDKWPDFLASTASLLGVAMPNFWLGPLLILVFSVHLNWLPVSERGDWTTYILPAMTMGTALAAILCRMTRNSVIRILRLDYVRTAKAKGRNNLGILVYHVLKNAALPVFTIVGLQFGTLLTGAIITETIFDWPGLGSLIVEALGSRDYPVIQGCVLVFSCLYLLVNLLTDIGYAFLDPRIRLDQNQE